jgi:hypothetical protein
LSAALQRCPAGQSLALLAQTVDVTQPAVVPPPPPPLPPVPPPLPPVPPPPVPPVPPPLPLPLHHATTFIAAAVQSAHDPHANDVPSLAT